MTTRADSERLSHPLFHAGTGGSTPTSALQLLFHATDEATFRRLNLQWHSRLPKIGSAHGRVFYAAEYDGRYFAVAMWSNPVARLLPQLTWLELRRFAIAEDAPKNTASRMLGWMARDIPKRLAGIERLISYQDTEAHTGTIYKAAGWTKTAASSGGQWSRPSRYRTPTQSASPKQRWEKAL